MPELAFNKLKALSVADEVRHSVVHPAHVLQEFEVVAAPLEEPA